MARMLSTDDLVPSQVGVVDGGITVNQSESKSADGFWEDADGTDPDSELVSNDNGGEQRGDVAELHSDDLPVVVSTVEETTTAETVSTQDAPNIEGIQSSSSTTEETSETSTQEIIWDEATERAKDEQAFFEQLKQARHELKIAESEWETAKSNAKIAKEEYTLAQAELYQIAEDGVVYRKKPQPKKPIIQPTDAPKQIPVSQSQPVQSEDWKKIETSTILAGIEGLGAKKRDLLIDSFPTFGKLMDARTEASKEHVSFASLLPKGIGDGIASEIIDRMDRAIVPGM